MFFVLVVLRRAQELRHLVVRLHRVSAVDLDCLAKQLLQMVKENLRMLLFLVCRKGEDRLNDMQLLLFRL